MSSITDLLTPVADAQLPGGNPFGSFVMGTVTENSEKKFAGMVKVQFTGWTKGKNITKWLPVLSSYAGKDYGQYIIPEVGDIVLVGFMGPQLEQPFVMGSFYPAGASVPSEQFSDKNINRHTKTKGGITVSLCDTDGKQSVQVQTPKGIKIIADDEKEAITISDKDGKNAVEIDCKGGEVKVSADKKMTLKAGKCEITLDGNSGAISIKCDQLKIEAGQTAKIKSGNMLKLEGGMVTVEGKQQLALKGTAMCEISGGMVKIN